MRLGTHWMPTIGCALLLAASAFAQSDVPKLADGRAILLAAHPVIQDSNYRQTVSVVAPGPQNGWIGVILNRPTIRPLASLFPEEPAARQVRDPAYFGGPTQLRALFALVRDHNAPGSGSTRMMEDLFFVNRQDEINRIIEQQPNNARYYVGYVAWRREDLQRQIEQGRWLVRPANIEDVFRNNTDGLWKELADNARLPQHAEARALSTAGLRHEAERRYAEAEAAYQRAAAILEKALGPDHTDLALALTNLASLHRLRKQYAAAEPLYERALAIREKSSGPDHLDFVATLISLSQVYRVQWKYAEATPLYDKRLTISEKIFGRDDPNMAAALSSYARFYQDQGRYAEAESAYKRSLAILERPPDRENRALSVELNNLATVYYDQGRYAEAEPLMRRSLAILEKARVPEFPDVWVGLHNLANVHRNQGRYEEAKLEYERCLSIVEKARGSDHPDVADTLKDFGALYVAKNEYAAAEPLLQRVVAILEKAPDPKRDLTQAILSLRSLYVKMGKTTEAQQLQERAESISGRRPERER